MMAPDDLNSTIPDAISDPMFGRRNYDQRLVDMERKIDKLTNDVEDLVNAWRAASWLVGAVKWLGSVAAAITAIYLLIKGFGK